MEKGQFIEKGQVHLFRTPTLCEPASSPPRPKPPAKAPLLPAVPLALPFARPLLTQLGLSAG